MIYALLSKIVTSRIYALLWAKSLRMPGLGGQPNLRNVCILGKNGTATPPLQQFVFQPFGPGIRIQLLYMTEYYHQKHNCLGLKWGQPINHKSSMPFHRLFSPRCGCSVCIRGERPYQRMSSFYCHHFKVDDKVNNCGVGGWNTS